MSRFGPFLVALLSLAAPLLPAAPSGAGPAASGVMYEWSFSRYLSNGAGGFTGPELVGSGGQTGGVVSEGVSVTGGGQLHAEVFSSEGAADSWALARSPFSANEAGDPIGSRAELSVSQIFRKDEADATLRFTIPDSELAAFHAFGPENEGLSGILLHSVEAGDFFAFSEQATLSGAAGAWTFANGAGVLPFEVTQGGLDQSSVTLEFSEPFVREIDLSSVPVGEEFAVEYRVIADAIDTAQGKSNARASGRDGLDESDGVTFEFTGLTPISAPEPGGPLLLAAGGALLAGLSRRRSR